MEIKPILEMFGIVLGVVVAFILTGMSVYVLKQMATPINSTVIESLADSLSSWGITWFPIILIVLGAGFIIFLLLSSFRE